MQYYGISPQRILGIISKPARLEEGIVKNTIAVMKPVSVKNLAGKPVWKQEIWVMYQKRGTRNPEKSLQSHGTGTKREANKDVIFNTKYKIPDTKYKIISAWRYPGISPKKNPIPEEIIREIQEI